MKVTDQTNKEMTLKKQKKTLRSFSKKMVTSLKEIVDQDDIGVQNSRNDQKKT